MVISGRLRRLCREKSICSIFRAGCNAAIAKAEHKLVSKIDSSPLYPPLFIVGPPRSGTTVIYLYLVNSLQFGYFPNVSKRHPEAPFVYAMFTALSKSYEPTYENRYGVVEGAMAPSDGWSIFHRWFPRYDRGQAVQVDSLGELRGVVRLFEKLFRAPFLNKNNNHPSRISQLAQLFPRAIFVHVTRETVSNVLSLMEARQAHGVKLNEWWSAVPRQSKRLFDSYLEQVTYQIVDAHEEIGESLAKISSDRYTTAQYKEFCSEPAKLRSWVVQRYATHGIRLAVHEDSHKSFVPSLRTAKKTVRREIDRLVANYANPAE